MRFEFSLLFFRVQCDDNQVTTTDNNAMKIWAKTMDIFFFFFL